MHSSRSSSQAQVGSLLLRDNARWHVSTGQAYLRWLRAARATLDVGVAAFIDRNTDLITDQLAAPFLLPLLKEASIADLLANHHDRCGNVCLYTLMHIVRVHIIRVHIGYTLFMVHIHRLGSYFRDPRLRAMFSFQTLYVGLTPYDAPAAFSLLAATELVDGVWYPMGGFQKVHCNIGGEAHLETHAQVADGLRAAAERCGAIVQTRYACKQQV